MQPTVTIVDDSDDFRLSLAGLVTQLGWPVRTCASGPELMSSLDPQAPGCVLLDVRMPDMDGLAVLSALVRTRYAPPVIMVTGHGDVPTAVEAMKRGAIDFLVKPFGPDELKRIIDRALRVDADRRQGLEQAENLQADLDSLTPEERTVLIRSVDGTPNKLIARELGVSLRTVHTRRATLMEKLKVKTRAQLAKIALNAHLDENNGHADQDNAVVSENGARL